MRLIASALLGMFAWLAAPALAQEPAPEAAIKVTIEKAGAEWQATFNFPQEEEAWGFFRSNRARNLDDSWRLESWQVETEGVELVRIGERDVLRRAGGTVPQQVTISFTPFAHDLYADYDPALNFSDGTVALFGGHFAVAPWSASDGLDEGSNLQLSLELSDAAGPVIFRGEPHPTLTTTDSNSYVLFGTPDLIETPDFTGLLDPEIPDWMRRELDSFLPQALAMLTGRLGEPSLDGKPMILATWAGPTPGLISRGGSVLEGLVTLRFEGEGMLTEQPAEINPTRWFLAHEAAHFWLGQTVEHPDSSAAWINEGGASLIAYRLIEQADPSYDAEASIAQDWQECLDLSANGPLDEADTRRDYRASYACGAVLGLIAEGAAQTNGNRDFFDFWRTLIDANRADMGGDGQVSVPNWIAQVTAESGDTSLAADLFRFIHHGAEDPAQALCGMLAKVERTAPGCAA